MRYFFAALVLYSNVALAENTAPQTAVPVTKPLEPMKIITQPDNGLPQFICQPTRGACITCSPQEPCFLYRPALK